ncbi:Mechanosensitive ion channel MscS protein [Raphanus sativus]|nr:Mechanosensitive ion channel MscS protein [Raphanus sativus]
MRETKQRRYFSRWRVTHSLEDLKRFLSIDDALKKIFRRTYEDNESIKVSLSFLQEWMLLLIRQPFDVGDEVEIQDIKLRVEELKLMHTVFIGMDRVRIQLSNFGLCAS